MPERLTGRPDCVIGAGPSLPGRVVIGLSSGAIVVGDYVDTASATRIHQAA